MKGWCWWYFIILVVSGTVGKGTICTARWLPIKFLEKRYVMLRRRVPITMTAKWQLCFSAEDSVGVYFVSGKRYFLMGQLF